MGKSLWYGTCLFEKCSVNEHVYIIRSSTRSWPVFLYYNFCNREIQEGIWNQVTGSAQPGLNSSFAKALHVPLPPFCEQQAIARFLDHTDRRIRRYICAMERLIELLEEQKQAIIHQAVTGQIDVRTGQPYPAYKNSEVEWLGDVPEHWEVRRLKTLSDMQSGDGITGMAIEGGGKIPSLRRETDSEATRRATHMRATLR